MGGDFQGFRLLSQGHTFLYKNEWSVGPIAIKETDPAGAIFTAILTPGREIGSVWIVLGLTLIGAIIALPQCWVLRQYVRHAAWWILAHGFGWGMIELLNSQASEPFAVLLVVATIPTIPISFACWLLLDWLPMPELEASSRVDISQSLS